MPGPDYRFRWNNYAHPNLVAAFDMSTRTPGGLLKNLAYTGATYDATIFGVPTYVSALVKGKTARCMNFGGVNEYLGLANPVNALTDYTIVCWVNEDAWDGVFFAQAAAGNFVLMMDSLSGFMLYPSLWPNNPLHHQPVSRTYMLALTRSSVTGNGTLFINGQFYYTNTMAAAVADANAFIGQMFGGALRLDGRLDNMMFYNVALTPAQIWAIWRSANAR